MNGSKPYSVASIGRTTRPRHPRLVVQCVLSPHPIPLPWGEGDPFTQQRTIQSRRLPIARCALFPLPEDKRIISWWIEHDYSTNVFAPGLACKVRM